MSERPVRETPGAPRLSVPITIVISPVLGDDNQYQILVSGTGGMVEASADFGVLYLSGAPFRDLAGYKAGLVFGGQPIALFSSASPGTFAFSTENALAAGSAYSFTPGMVVPSLRAPFAETFTPGVYNITSTTGFFGTATGTFTISVVPAAVQRS